MSLIMGGLLARHQASRPADRDRSRAASSRPVKPMMVRVLSLTASTRLHRRTANQFPSGPTMLQCWLLLLAVRSELVDIGPKAGDLPVVLDPAESHSGAGNHGRRIVDILLERSLIPGDARVLVCIGIIEALNGAGLAAVKPIERRAELDLGIFPYIMAGAALVERLLARRDVLRQAGAGRSENKYPSNNPRPHHSLLSFLSFPCRSDGPVFAVGRTSTLLEWRSAPQVSTVMAAAAPFLHRTSILRHLSL